MQHHEILVTLPTSNGWVAVQSPKPPVLDIPPSGASYLGNVELAYATCHALLAVELELGGGINVLTAEQQAEANNTPAPEETTVPVLGQLTSVAHKVDVIRFEQKLLKEQDSLHALMTQLITEEDTKPQPADESQPAPEPADQPTTEAATDETDCEVTGAWIMAFDEPEEQAGAAFMAAEAPQRIRAESDLVKNIKKHPTHFSAQEAILALNAINHLLENTASHHDTAELTLLWAAKKWVLQNTESNAFVSVS
jgi:hypothetical protein